MNIEFKTTNMIDGTDVITSFNNLPDALTWAEVFPMFIKHLNNMTYRVDSEMESCILDAIDEETNARYNQLMGYE